MKLAVDIDLCNYLLKMTAEHMGEVIPQWEKDLMRYGAEQFADQLKTRLKLYQFEMEERGLQAQTIHIEGIMRIIDRTLEFQDIDQIEELP